ncbi:hypothetical protein H261_20442 [Paramagnetospirillum caucaseum]|uniref:Uncharacterized protein n=1 Tax=Paramagnetospirillum caucaseum TaxID=1244869 RepID=M2Z1A9_9PROT|nr:hypothetical protein [Paramagnetospirillum caucaseum]EME68050.1 hypothetical protein H261_20442 [Paramagnetospirillum caucaseum]
MKSIVELKGELQKAEQRKRRADVKLAQLKRAKSKTERQKRAEMLHSLGGMVLKRCGEDGKLLKYVRKLVERDAGVHLDAFEGTPLHPSNRE